VAFPSSSIRTRSFVKVTLVYGFLGTGKTTLLRRLIPRLQPLGRIAVLVNEFGREGIDQHVLRTADVRVRELTGGCICCEVRGDMLAALVQISRDVAPERLVVEPTGLAAPYMLGQVFTQAEVREIAQVDSIVTVVDASRHAVAHQAFGDFYVDQMRVADVLAINKADIATSEQIETARDAARRLNPDAALAVTSYADIDLDLVLAAIAAPRPAPAAANGNHGHDHGEQPELSTLGLERATLQPGPLARDHLDRWLAALARGEFGDVVRAKGIVRADNATLLVDVVMGSVEVRTFRPTPARVEVIGRNLDPRSMEKSLANGHTHIPSPSLT
jgi:G3E family GTPase